MQGPVAAETPGLVAARAHHLQLLVVLRVLLILCKGNVRCG